MSYTASNVNYGYAVATNKTFVAISNPSAFVYLNDTLIKVKTFEISFFNF